MPLFHFIPIRENLSHFDWTASTEKRGCYVWGANEQDAIRIIKLETSIAATKSNPNQKIATSPWNNPELVLIKEVAHIAGDPAPLGTFWFEEFDAK